MRILLDDDTGQNLTVAARLQSLSPDLLANMILEAYLEHSRPEYGENTCTPVNPFSEIVSEAKENRESYHAGIEAYSRMKEDRFIRARRILESQVRPLLVLAEDVIEEMETHVDLSGILYRETFSGQGHLHLVLKTRCLHTDRIAKLKFIASPTSERIAARSSGRDGTQRVLKIDFGDKALFNQVDEVVRNFIIKTV